MTRYVLDTNLFIEAARDRAKAEELKAFSSAFLPFLHFHAVVAQELLAGAVTARWRRDLADLIVGPYQRRGRVVVPTFAAWRRSGEIVAELVQAHLLAVGVGGVARSFANDALIAASCREEGFTLITRNVTDFDLIARVEPFRFLPPWPAPARRG